MGWEIYTSKIIFVSGSGELRDLFIINEDGSDKKQLTNTDFSVEWPSWSPSEPLLIFESGKDGNPEIYTINADTGEDLTRLTNNEKLDEWPCFSQDGSMIMWSHGVEGDKDLWVMNADGSNKRQLTQNIAVGDAFSSFLPDGSRVVFTSASEGQHPSICVIYLDGSGLKKIAEGSSANWSPNF